MPCSGRCRVRAVCLGMILVAGLLVAAVFGWPLLFQRSFEVAPAPTSQAQTTRRGNELLARVQDNMDQDFRPRVVFAHALPAITKLRVYTAQEAQKLLRPDELVLGVVVEGQARAYPINSLTGPHREVFNDTLAGRPIAATW